MPMVLPRCRSALFIDFENLPLSPDALPSWLAWLEDGQFHHGRPRRFLVKRVYWNSSAEKHRDKYEAAGFEVVLCEKFANRKNGADIRMAVDIVETIHTRPRIDEYILVTVDSDFVPVLQRLQMRNKRSVVLVDEERPDHHTICRRHADVLIPIRKLVEARQYRRPPGPMRRLWQSLRSAVSAGGAQPSPTAGGPALSHRQPSLAAAIPSAPRGSVAIVAPRPPRRGDVVSIAIGSASSGPASVAGPTQRRGAVTPSEAVAAPAVALDTARETSAARLTEATVERIVEVVSRRSGDFTGRTRIMAALRGVAGFTVAGPDCFLGFGSYRALMHEVAHRDRRVRIVEADGGGIGVVFAGTEASALPQALGSDLAAAPTAAAATAADGAEAGHVAGTAAPRPAEPAIGPPPLRIVSNDR